MLTSALTYATITAHTFTLGNIKTQPLGKLEHPKKPSHSQVQVIKKVDPPLVPLAPMTLEPFHFAAMGTYQNAYELGQCTWGAASMKGNIPDSWGNANNWPAAAEADGYTVSNTPIAGAVAADTSGYDGHVAVVTAVYPDYITIEEMNYDYNGSVRTRDATYNEFVYIYI